MQYFTGILSNLPFAVCHPGGRWNHNYLLVFYGSSRTVLADVTHGLHLVTFLISA